MILCHVGFTILLVLSCVLNLKFYFYLKIIQCDFLDFFSHSWGVPTMKMTDLSILCKWENLKNRQCIKYLFAPLYLVYRTVMQFIDDVVLYDL